VAVVDVAVSGALLPALVHISSMMADGHRRPSASDSYFAAFGAAGAGAAAGFVSCNI
jgi:hypothetical protein